MLNIRKRPEPFVKEIIVKPSDIKPPSSNEKVVGVFNPGVSTAKIENGEEKTILMLRIAVTKKDDDNEWINLPYFPVENKKKSPFEIKYDRVTKKSLLGDREKDVSLWDHTTRLKHISYPLVAVSEDGLKLDKIEDIPSFYPCYEHERFGIEDVRITKLNSHYVFTYTSPHRTSGVSTSIGITEDFKNFGRLPLWNHPKPIFIGSKDVALFPEKCPSIHSAKEKNPIMDYPAFIRPNAFAEISRPKIWITYSGGENSKRNPHWLLYWGDSEVLIENQDGGYVGTGPPPLKIKDKWISPFHEVKERENKNIYRTRMFGLDAGEPWSREKVIVSDVLIEPNEFNISKGYVPNVVYSSGFVIREEGLADIYSGEDDSYVSVRRYYLEDLVKFLYGD